jgi:hypothetical protein
MKLIIEYDEIAPGDLPEDPGFDAEGWTFTPLEHDEMTFPRAINATDAQGRSYSYLAVGGALSGSRD